MHAHTKIIKHDSKLLKTYQTYITRCTPIGTYRFCYYHASIFNRYWTHTNTQTHTHTNTNTPRECRGKLAKNAVVVECKRMLT